MATNGPLADLVAEIPTYPIRRQNIEVAAPEKATLIDRVASLVTERYDASSITTLDGVRIETETGWMLIRASGTQPLVRLTAEARTDDDVERLLAEAENLVATARSEE
ncbi:phosphohexomutase domain-containing protein [Haloplanus rallus]|uniref:hypothetical protein n=1 Tax=Haloplanus rallus TaxID=1816183 RepID=UPI001E426A59|nr:hypothetical protein [Haloplanus rallus]